MIELSTSPKMLLSLITLGDFFTLGLSAAGRLESVAALSMLNVGRVGLLLLLSVDGRRSSFFAADLLSRADSLFFSLLFSLSLWWRCRRDDDDDDEDFLSDRESDFSFL